MISIESLSEEDLPGLKKVYEEGFKSSPGDINCTQNIFSEIKDNKSYNILCAKVKGEVVGSVMGVACLELFGNCRPFMVVENVVVLQSHRRLGIARMLLTELEERAKNWTAPRCFLFQANTAKKHINCTILWVLETIRLMDIENN